MLVGWPDIALVAAAVFTAMGFVWARIYAWLWERIHGADRTRRAARAIVLAALAVQAVGAALLLAYGEGDAQLAVLVGLWLLGLVPYGLALYAVLRRPPVPDAVARAPSGLVQDHDGVSFSVPWHPAGVSAVLLVLAVALPVPMAFAAMGWSRSRRTTRVRVRNDELEVGGVKLRLHGARLAEEVRADGTPILTLSTPDARVAIPVGGAPPAEVAWVRETLAAAIRDAEEVRVPPQPEALRRLRVQQ